MKKEVMKVFETYTEGLSKGTLEVVFATMSDDIVWHMGGESSLSGTVRGKEALAERLGEFDERSDGTFRVITNWATSNDCFVAASVVSLAERDGEKLRFALDTQTPEDIDFISVEEVNEDFHSRYWKHSKTYEFIGGRKSEIYISREYPPQ